MKQDITQTKNEALPQEVAAVYDDCVRAIEETKQWFKLNYKKDKKKVQGK